MIRRRVAIIGSGGRLGQALARHYREEFELIEIPRAKLDLAERGAVRRVLEPVKCDAMVNCAALTNVDYCETHAKEAMRVNAEAVGELAELCAEREVRLIHISTDYVFDGEAHAPYSEDDATRAISVYGESKLAGEEQLLRQSPDHLAVRVSWVFGPDRPSFIDAIIKRATEHDHAEAVGDKFSTPTYTADAAVLLKPLIFDIQARGVLHLCNAGECTWQEYGQWGLDCAAEAGIVLRATKVESLRMENLKAFVARRPVYSVMGTQKLTSLTGMQPRPWQDAVREYVTEFVAPSLPTHA